MLHELTEIVLRASQYKVEDVVVDKVIREWLEKKSLDLIEWKFKRYEKANEDNVKLLEILGLTPDPVKKIAQLMKEKAIGNYGINLISNWEELAKLDALMAQFKIKEISNWEELAKIALDAAKGI